MASGDGCHSGRTEDVPKEHFGAMPVCRGVQVASLGNCGEGGSRFGKDGELASQERRTQMTVTVLMAVTISISRTISMTMIARTALQ